jgi:hypothetical protein
LLSRRERLYISPPLGELGISFPAARTQLQKIIGSTKLLVVKQSVSAPASAVLEAQLHDEHSLHGRTESPRIGRVPQLFRDQLVARVEKGLYFTGLLIGPNSLL